jgi:hypothetical protein
MPTATTWTDRLRIERALWTLDTHVQSLPGSSRRAIRRELRTNLRASATDVGVAEAIRQLGSLHQLASGYLDAEYEGRPRPRVLKAALWTVAVGTIILWSTFVGHSAFVDGMEAANPHPNGTFTWDGMEVLGVGGDVSYADGHLRSFGLSFNLWMLLYLVAAFLIGGRFWRLVPRWWRRRSRARAV